MARSTQFSKHRQVRQHLAQIYDQLRNSNGKMKRQELEELKSAANVLRLIKEVLSIEQNNEIMEKLEALKQQEQQSNEMKVDPMRDSLIEKLVREHPQQALNLLNNSTKPLKRSDISLALMAANHRA